MSAEAIREALLTATLHDAQARTWRREAGRLLAQMRDRSMPETFAAELWEMGLDLRTAVMLIQDFAGGKEAEDAGRN